MENWKRAAIAASAGVATVLMLKGRRPAGVLVAGVGLAVLASEYPEKFEGVQRSLPDYFDRGMRLMEMTSRIGRKIAQFAGQGGQGIWDELSS